ncbi:ABC transporter permease subunit [Proteiniclasticum sp. C24MP]|uniref:ABC transporter permease subunit n=1 Tax=Proteiniclasticum sp. C24MP TaxID=3374101 RepID=UPI0037546C5C
MAKYKRILVDYIGREYERKNLYLKEYAELEEKISEMDASEKKNLAARLKELKIKKDQHPYNVELKAFKDAEKTFLSKQKEEVEKFRKTVPEDLSDVVRDLTVKIRESELEAGFYEDYTELSYDAEFLYKRAKAHLRVLPKNIEEIAALETELSEAKHLDASGDHSAIKAEITSFREKQKKLLDERTKELRDKKKQGLISDKALKNGISQIKKDFKHLTTIKSFEDPVKNKKELIKSKTFELKNYIKVTRRILDADIADIRRSVPVEVEKTSPVIAHTTFLLPGLGQLLNRQYMKALLFGLGALFIYFIAIPYALGYGNYQGEGVAGLISLAEGGKRVDKSLIFLIEGIIAIMFLLIAFAIYFTSFNDVKSTEKGIIKGTRSFNWFETKSHIEEEGFPILVSMPALLIIMFIVLVPIFTAILLSFTGMDPRHQSKFSWVGLENYMLIATGTGLAGSVFWKILGWTIIWTLTATTLAIFIGFGLALLVNNPRVKGKGIFRMIYLLPWAVPAFITIMFFSIMFSKTGALTTIANDLTGLTLDFKNNTNLTRMILVMLQGWLGSSYVFLLSTGVLQAIPEDLYEAADIDGANSWQKIRKITLPLVLFQTAPLLVNQYTFNFNNFSIIYLFNGGGPFNPEKYGNLAGSTDILISYIFKLTTENQYQAIGAAITIVISLGLMMFAFFGYRNSKAFKEERL